MVVLADEILESFFETDFTGTFRLEPVPMMDIPSHTGLLGDLWTSLTSDDNKKIFNRLTDGVGRAVGKHQVFNRPAIGKFTALEEPKARESLLTPTMRRSASKASLKSPDSESAAPPSSVSAPANLAVPEKPADGAPQSAGLSPMPTMYEAAASAAAAFMERTPFAIDDAKDDEDETDDETDEEDEDDGVMDEVDAFLEAHDSGLTEAERELAQGASFPTVYKGLNS